MRRVYYAVALLAMCGGAGAAERKQFPDLFQPLNNAVKAVANPQAAVGNLLQQLSNWVSGDLSGAITLSTAVPGLQDGNGHDCWVAAQAFGEVLQKHPLPVTLKAATDIEALRLDVAAANQLCNSAACTKVSSDAQAAVTMLNLGIPVMSVSDLCAKLPTVQLVTPEATPVPTPTPTGTAQ